MFININLYNNKLVKKRKLIKLYLLFKYIKVYYKV